MELEVQLQVGVQTQVFWKSGHLSSPGKERFQGHTDSFEEVVV